MLWHDIQDKLRAVARQIRQNKALDAATEALLDKIPVVGGFLSNYWKKTADAGKGSAEEFARFMEVVAQQKEAFDNLSALVGQHGQQLIEQRMTLGEILLLVGELRGDVKTILSKIDGMVATLKIGSAREAFEVATAMRFDHGHSADRLKQAQKVLEAAGEPVGSESYHQLGMLYVTMGRYEDAEACLLEAVQSQPNQADGFLGLGMIYQRRATEHLRLDNFGLAEDAVQKAQGYVKTALMHNPADMGIQTHLGYVMKDMAQRYLSIGQRLKGGDALEQANQYFENALRCNPNDASAHNGLGSLCLIQGDYDGAIERCGKALQLNPDYLFARFDLAQACYYKAKGINDRALRQKCLLRGREAYLAVKRLDGGGPGCDSLPPQARQAIDQMYQAVQAEINQMPGR